MSIHHPTNTPRITKYTVFFLFIFSLFLFAPHADAKIVVNGEREFTDDVNECLNTYRNAPGIVGDVIKELENSAHEHRIVKSPDWSNAPNDITKATGGSGSGSVTRVDKVELEKYKKDFPELKDKDFCTALLHELWHAIDNDRGTRTAHSDKVDGVKRNEIEATIFQNFIHSIRGVPVRTMYGGVDMSKILFAGDELKKEEVAVSATMEFKHVKPGEYSEVYATIKAKPNCQIEVTLTGPGVDDTATKTASSDSSGNAKVTWRIVSYGTYALKGKCANDDFTAEVHVK